VKRSPFFITPTLMVHILAVREFGSGGRESDWLETFDGRWTH